MIKLGGTRGSQGVIGAGQTFLDGLMKSTDLAVTCAGPTGWQKNSTKEHRRAFQCCCSLEGSPVPQPCSCHPEVINLVPILCHRHFLSGCPCAGA